MRKLRTARAVWALLLSVSLPAHAAVAKVPAQQVSEPTPEARRLEPGVSVALGLAGGDKHYYKIELTARQHVGLQLSKQGIVIALTFQDPAGKTLAEAYTNGREQGEETLSLITQTAGPHTLTIEPVFPKAAAGRYTLLADRPRTPTADDRQRFNAQQRVAEADVLFAPRTAEGYRASMKKLDEALPLWQSVGDRAGEAKTLQRKGMTHFWLNEYEAALEQLNRALAVSRAADDPAGEAEALRVIGLVYAHRSDNPRALEHLNRALALHRRLDERWQTASIYRELAQVYWKLGKVEETDSNFDKAVRLMRETGDIENEAGTLASLGLVQITAGDYQAALDRLLPSLEIFRQLKNPYAEASTLSNLGLAYFNLGDAQKALEHFEQSLAIYVRIEFPPGQSAVHTHLGLAHDRLGNKGKALEHFEKALELQQKLNNPRSRAITLRHAGKLYGELGEQAKALEHLDRALRLGRELEEPAIQGGVLTALGELFGAMGEREKALEHIKQALSHWQAVRSPHDEAATLYVLARTERDAGRLHESLNHIAAAIDIVETLREKVAGSDLRISYLTTHQNYYELYVELLMLLHEQSPAGGYDARALHVTERARARALLESLAEAGADIRQGVSPALLERERALREELNVKEERRFRVLSGKHKPEQAAAAERDVQLVLEQHKRVQAQIRAASPRFAALTQPRPLDLGGVQAQLDEGTLLLVYSLGRRRSFLFAVTTKGLQSHVLPARDVIEKEAEEVYEPLRKNALVMAQAGDGSQSVTNAGAEQRQLLSRRLLGPVAGLSAGKRLVIVADGKLQYVPFAALPAPGGEQPLIAGHEVVILPSVSVLGQQRRELGRRPAAPETLAVIADPVYEADDARLKTGAPDARAVKARGQGRPAPRRTSARRGRGVTEAAGRVKPLAPGAREALAAAVSAAKEDGPRVILRRLTFTRGEADELASLVPQGRYAKLLDFDASRATLARTDLSRFRIIHFATHGLLDPRNPELSGVVLSLYDADGRAQDGFLRAHEVYNLKLGADLIVLSACQTALGKDVRGEGLIGMTHGFMYAGAPRVVVSLWKVDDGATAELMKLFYAGMLRQKLRPAEALRAAQAAMARARDSRWSAPYYWAGFTLQGEWR